MRLRLFFLAASLSLTAACGGSGSSDPGGGGGGNDLVSVAIINPSRAVPSGGLLQLEISVTNPGSREAQNVSLNIAAVTGIQSVQMGCQVGYTNCGPEGNAASIPALPAGAVWRILAVVRLAQGFRGAIDTTLSVTASGDDNSANNRAQLHVNAWSTDISVAGSVQAGEFLSGGNATYVMTLTNTGPDAAPALVARNSLTGGQSLVSIACVATGGATCPTSSGAVMQVPGMPAGGSLAFTVTAQIASTSIGTIGSTLSVELAGDTLTANNASTVWATTRVPVSPVSPSFVVLQSDTGDNIGGGLRYAYDRANAILEVAAGSRISINVRGDESWQGEIRLPGNPATLVPGVYVGLPRSPTGSGGNFSWTGGNGCSTSITTLILDDVTYTASGLATLDLRFEQHCDGGGPALRGQVHWNASDMTMPPGPVNPAPAGLWSPAAGATPASGNYVYLQSDAGDYIGAGRTQTYTPVDSLLAVTLNSGRLQVSINGDERWNGVFAAMTSIAQLAPGYYGNLSRHPFDNPARGSLLWSGSGRSCSTLTGWFVVDSISFSGAALNSIDLRFEQHCEGAPAALRGRIHWTDGDAAQPPGPQQPPPAGLWSPAAGATPAAGDYVYLQSDPGDYIGQGRTETYTHADALLDVQLTGAHLTVGITRNSQWFGDFQGMNTLSQLQAGYYGNLQGYPVHNPARGGLSWSGESRACNTMTGWFVVDSITFSGSALASLDLRFEQHCGSGGPALRGQIHWIN
jgi:hypothetical protein